MLRAKLAPISVEKGGIAHTLATCSRGPQSNIFCQLVPVLQRGLGSSKRWSQEKKPLGGRELWGGVRFDFPCAITERSKVQNGLEVQTEGRTVAVQESGKSENQRITKS